MKRLAWAQRLSLCTVLAAVAALLVQGTVCAQVQTQREPPALLGQAAPATAAVQSKGGVLLDAPSPAPAREPAPPAYAAAWLRQINAMRAAGATCGNRRYESSPPLRWNLQLEQAALLHSREQAARNNMTHDGADGSSVGDRMARQGYAWDGAAENVAAGHADMAAAIVGWLNSPGHCRNLMGPSFNDVAVAQAPASGQYRAYYTMVLGKRGAGSANPLSAELAQVRDPKAALALINQMRAQGGTCGKHKYLPSPPLQWDDRLARVAQWSAMQSAGRKAEDDPVNFVDRMKAAGFPARLATAMSSSGGPAPLPAVNGMWGSEGSCMSLLGDSYSHMGLAGAQEPSSARGSSWWWNLVLAR